MNYGSFAYIFNTKSVCARATQSTWAIMWRIVFLQCYPSSTYLQGKKYGVLYSSESHLWLYFCTGSGREWIRERKRVSTCIKMQLGYCVLSEWEKQFIEEASSMYTFLLVGTFFLSLLAAADFGNPIFYAQQDTYILSIQCCVWAVTYWKHRLCFARETNYTFNFLIQLLHDCCQWFSKNAAAAMSRQACEWVKQSMPFFFTLSAEMYGREGHLRTTHRPCGKSCKFLWI